MSAPGSVELHQPQRVGTEHTEEQRDDVWDKSCFRTCAWKWMELCSPLPMVFVPVAKKNIEARRSQPCQKKWRSWLPVARHAGRLRLFCSQDTAGNDWRLQRSHQKIHQIKKCKNLCCLLDTFWWLDNQTLPFGGRDSAPQCSPPEIMLESFLWPFLSTEVNQFWCKQELSSCQCAWTFISRRWQNFHLANMDKGNRLSELGKRSPLRRQLLARAAPARRCLEDFQKLVTFSSISST